MDKEALKQSLSKTTESLKRVNEAFEAHLTELKEKGEEGEPLKQANEAVHSMRDSSSIFIAWAHHYLGIPEEGAEG